MIIEAEFNEIEDAGTGAELEFPDDDSLPWLEADEEEIGAGGVDTAQLVGFVAALLAVLLLVVAGVWYASNRGVGPVPVADGSTIEAPEGPYKERPEDAGGKEFKGTGDVAPGVGQGQAPDGRLASSTGAGSGEPDLDINMPPIEGGGASAELGGAASAGNAGAQSGANQERPPSAAGSTAAPAAAAASGVGVQLAAYSSPARAEAGWRELQGQSQALKGLEHRVLKGEIAIGVVYRLQAVTSSRAEADALCRTLKGQGLDCQVKP